MSFGRTHSMLLSVIQHCQLCVQWEEYVQEYNCKHALYFRLHREMQGTQIQVKGLQQVSMSLFHCDPARCSPEVLKANFDTLLRQVL